jgi:bifunctional UDP-N-acetylglucosamine pyrophosphorylase/glucosamine-1-phosphate N-acetyltransferase
MTAAQAILLAAGKGTRMNSDLAKVLHPLRGRPMLHYAIETTAAATGAPPIIIIGHQAEQVQAAGLQLSRAAGARAPRYVIQSQQLGTGHAVQQAETLLRGASPRFLITSGDMPLFRPDTLRRLIERQAGSAAPLAIATVIADDPRGFGRIVRSADGAVQAVVEEADATIAQKAIRELNVGAYCVDDAWLWDALRKITPSPKGEYYLTDLVGIAVRERQPVQTFLIADPAEAIGINTPAHLAEAEAILQSRRAQQPRDSL